MSETVKEAITFIEQGRKLANLPFFMWSGGNLFQSKNLKNESVLLKF